MRSEALTEALRLAEGVGYVLVATADGEGRPHVSVAGRMEAASGPRVSVSAWFCPGTVENVAVNGSVALIVWDPRRDAGYQLLGRLEEVEEIGMLDGYWPEADEADPMPQVERRLLVRVDRILSFTAAPHTDQPV